ncbi:transporter substrate-binding domain-containing protein [Vibrio sp. S4M6]|uniref:substrate-binding periplasmic protein n=1 Tax=Vibrio sinus TaxID=2946865 RepID=UPI00202AB79F|nr:transporter substrate-binding domain-containing protein [Vibrio sinus]
MAEIIDIASSRIGLDVSWITVPWARTIKVAEYGGVDIIPRHSMNHEREAFLNAVVYGYQTRNVYYMMSPQLDTEINELSDLDGLKVGAIRGSFYSENFANAQHINKLYFNNTDQIIKMLKSNRIDVAITSSNHHEEKFRAETDLRQANYVDVFYNGRYISIPIKSPMAKYWPQFKEQIEVMRADGEVDKIFNKYSLPPPSQK